MSSLDSGATIQPKMYAIQDDCLIAIQDKRPLSAAKLKLLPPWRAVLVARIAAQAGVGIDRGTLGQLEAVANEVGGKGELGDWWTSPA